MHLYITALTKKMGLIFFLTLCSAGTADTTSHPLDQTLPTGDIKSIVALVVYWYVNSLLTLLFFSAFEMISSLQQLTGKNFSKL